MSLKDKASLIFKPSRYKSGKAYSFRGSDVTVSRSSVGTRVNAEGKIEEVASNMPRINYDPADLTKCPVLLTEKDSTNHFSYSNDFTQSDWSKDKVTIVPNAAVSPDGTNNASLMYINNSGNATYINDNLSDSNNFYRTISAYVKPAGRNKVWLYVNSSSAYGVAYFDLAKKTVTATAGSTSTPTGKITELSDGWFRIEATTGSTTQLSGGSGIGISDANTLYGTVMGTAGVYIYGLQIEGTGKATSLINTNGSAATRADEIVTASSPINGARGSFYFNLSQMNTIGYGTTVPTIALYKTNTTTGAIGLLDNNVTQGEMRAMARINGSLYGYNTHFSAPNGVKMCFVWDSNDNDTKAYKNGVLWGTIGQSFTQTLSDGLVLNASTRENFLEYEEVLVYNERLSEAEAIALTSYDDYAELVERNDLTWESPTITNNRLTALKEL